MYRSLNAQYIVATTERLASRIGERFPDSGLSRVAAELVQLAKNAVDRAQWLRKPRWAIRATALVAMALLVAAIAAVVLSIRISPEIEKVADLLQAVEAVINEIILFALALLFLISLEARIKRRRALKALHQLRSICHVIDMHQLTKDPHTLTTEAQPTQSSPQRVLTTYQLARYLDYCSELLSLASKLAALHVQYLPDPVVLDAVNDVETLAAGLSQKIWQKVSLLQQAGRSDLEQEEAE